jgi:hypothetical protein
MDTQEKSNRSKKERTNKGGAPQKTQEEKLSKTIRIRLTEAQYNGLMESLEVTKKGDISHKIRHFLLSLVKNTEHKKNLPLIAEDIAKRYAVFGKHLNEAAKNLNVLRLEMERKGRQIKKETGLIASVLVYRRFFSETQKYLEGVQASAHFKQNFEKIGSNLTQAHLYIKAVEMLGEEVPSKNEIFKMIEDYRNIRKDL